MSNHTTNSELCQVDKHDNALISEISQKFTPKKQASELLSASYNRLGYEHKAERVSSCGTFLEFAAFHSFGSGVVNYICVKKYTHNKTTR